MLAAHGSVAACVCAYTIVSEPSLIEWRQLAHNKEGVPAVMHEFHRAIHPFSVICN